MLPIEQIKSDIKTVGLLKDITQALQQDAAHFLRERRSQILKSREFFQEAWEVYSILRTLVPSSQETRYKKLVILITPNRGIYGRLLNQAVEEAKKIYEEKETDLLVTGKKGQSFFSDRTERTTHFFTIDANVDYEDIRPIKEVIAKYREVYIVYCGYVSTSDQGIAVAKFDPSQKAEKKTGVASKQYLIEPEKEKVINYFNEALSGVLFYSYFSESMLSYKAAEMILMKNGFDNAEEMEKELEMSFYRAKRELKDAKLRDLYSGRISSQSKF